MGFPEEVKFSLARTEKTWVPSLEARRRSAALTCWQSHLGISPSLGCYSVSRLPRAPQTELDRTMDDSGAETGWIISSLMPSFDWAAPPYTVALKCMEPQRSNKGEVPLSCQE